MSDYQEGGIGQHPDSSLRIKASLVNFDASKNQILKKISVDGQSTGVPKKPVLDEFFKTHPLTLQEQEGLLSASNSFLEQVLACSPSQTGNAFFTNQLHDFIVDFPANIYTRLQGIASVDFVKRIIKIGTDAVVKDDDLRATDRLALDLKNFSLSQVCSLMGVHIPDAMNGLHVDPQTMLSKIETGLVQLSDIAEYEKFVDYYRIAGELSPEERERVNRFEMTMSELDPGFASHTNLLAQKSEELWSFGGEAIGLEKRIPRWADFGVMVRTTLETNHEYGMAVTQIDGNESEIQFVGGGAHNISNMNRPRKGTIFIHSHPCRTSEMNTTSPLVSIADLDANFHNDSGGGYLNSASLNGMTLFIGRTQETALPRKDKMIRDRVLYRVESGQLIGKQISEFGAHNDSTQTLAVMDELKKTQKSYVYSVDDGESTYRFLHVPWELMDPKISVNSLCFGDGLVQLMQQVEGVPNSIISHRNLEEAYLTSK